MTTKETKMALGTADKKPFESSIKSLASKERPKLSEGDIKHEKPGGYLRPVERGISSN
jgi:hypothetical protein